MTSPTNLTSSIQVSEEMIEAGAKAAYDDDRLWVVLSSYSQQRFREQASRVYLAMRSKDHSIAVDDVREKYEELIYAVSIKHPQEDRHETALRYIRQAEAGSTASLDRQGK